MTPKRIDLPEAGERVLMFTLPPGGAIQVMTWSGEHQVWTVFAEGETPVLAHVEIRWWTDRGR